AGDGQPVEAGRLEIDGTVGVGRRPLARCGRDRRRGGGRRCGGRGDRGAGGRERGAGRQRGGGRRRARGGRRWARGGQAPGDVKGSGGSGRVRLVLEGEIERRAVVGR